MMVVHRRRARLVRVAVVPHTSHIMHSNVLWHLSTLIDVPSASLQCCFVFPWYRAFGCSTFFEGQTAKLTTETTIGRTSKGQTKWDKQVSAKFCGFLQFSAKFCAPKMLQFPGRDLKTCGKSVKICDLAPVVHCSLSLFFLWNNGLFAWQPLENRDRLKSLNIELFLKP